ncbi:MAG: DUF2330 domain-containing protein, partial [Phycisphaerae bacterium]|nr:DUF2330 domain-containing protein [Phycisphaerae bacterium]
EIAIINVENSNDLAEWLTVNGYSKWSEEEANTASNYIKSGWHFVTVKFHKDKDGSSKVGPVAITFDSKQPVYPTCFLTNEGKDIYLELFVVTDTNQSANALGRGLHEGCWRFRYLENMKFKDDEYSCKKAFGNTTQLSLIGHPDSFNVMWDGCVVTKLCGNVGRKDLHSNIFFDYSSKENHTKYYSSRGAFVHSLIIGVFSWSALLVIATIFYQKWIQFAGRYAIKKILGIIILASALVFAGTFVYLPNVKTQSTSFHVRASCLVGNVEEIISPEMEIDEVRSILEKRIEQWRKGESYDACLKKIREFDSPGNYIIFEDERGVVVRVFYSGCRWKDIVTGELEDDAKTF